MCVEAHHLYISELHLSLSTAPAPAGMLHLSEIFDRVSNHAYRHSSMEEIFIDTSPTGW